MANELIKIETVVEDLKTIPEVIKNHQLRTSKAVEVGQNIILSLEENGGECTVELDERAKKFLTNCSSAKTQMIEARSGYTQIFDAIKKLFTEEENKLDPKTGDVPKKIQGIRDGYAKKVFEDQEKRRREADEKLRRERAKSEIEEKFGIEIAQTFENIIFTRVAKVSAAFNGITLSDFESKSINLKIMNVDPDEKLIAETMKSIADKIDSTCLVYKIDVAEWPALREKIVDAYSLDAFRASYKGKMTDLRNQLVDRLPGLKAELEAKAKASDEERIQIEKDKAERERLQAAKIEADRIAAQEKAKADAEAKKAASDAEALFNATTESAVEVQAPEARTGFAIIVSNPAGWVELFQLWFKEIGVKMDPSEMGSVKLDAMKKFAEDLAKKSDTRIESKFLKYEPTFKAVNRKAKA